MYTCSITKGDKMTKYITQAGDTTADEFVGRIRELKDKITRRNKQIKALKDHIDDLNNQISFLEDNKQI